jgi:hypothetical protein
MDLNKETYSLVSLLLPFTSSMCLERKTWFYGLFGSKKFTVCEERSLWIKVFRDNRAGKETYCLVTLLLPSTSGMYLERKTWFLGLFGSKKVGMENVLKVDLKIGDLILLIIKANV